MTTPEAPRPDSAGLPRRTVLGAVTAGGAVLLTAGCGAGVRSGGSTGGASEKSPAPSAAGDKLVASADVPVGGGVKVEGKPLFVVQPESGTFKGLSAICTHAGCEMKQVSDGLIKCPCHGRAFSVEDGSVKSGPARAPLSEVKVAVEGDSVVTA